MLKKAIFLLFVVGFQFANAGGCCCIPALSCVSVIATMEMAVADNKLDISNEDNTVGESWNSTIEEVMKKIEKLKEQSLKHQTNITNLEYANVIESYKEEFNYLSLLNYKKNSFDEKKITNTALLLDSELTIRLKQMNSGISSETQEFLKK